MLAKVLGSAVIGIQAQRVTIEVNVENGINFVLVGLPDASVKESQHRIACALRSIGLRWPGRQVVINMAPADIRKEGAAYDLPLSMGILAAAEHIPLESLDDSLFMGELSLDGSLRPIKGALCMAIRAKAEGLKRFYLPMQNYAEAACIPEIQVIPVRHLRELVHYFKTGEGSFEPHQIQSQLSPKTMESTSYPFDFSEVKGQESAKRAIEVACAGNHNLLMSGSPGCGKSMLAKRIPSILPPLSLEESIELTQLYSVLGMGQEGLIKCRPFRSPHHTASLFALTGGGSPPMPGEISLASHGVLFLDEFPEYSRSAIEALRQPLEDHKIIISRAKYSVSFPAKAMLVAAMNPCPCGYAHHPGKACVCTPGMIQRYRNRISGPIFDRIDIHIDVPFVPFDTLHHQPSRGNSAEMRERIMRARTIQEHRFQGRSHLTNAYMTAEDIRNFAPLDSSATRLIESAMNTFSLSARAYDKIVKVARTIADLEGSERVQSMHIAEAIRYRRS